jgi:diguanylate cyclase
MEVGFEVGDDDYIKKPFDPEELVLRIKRKLKSDENHDKELTALKCELEYASKESQEDFLTKVNNRRSLDNKLNELDAEYKRLNRDFILGFIDIDFFKRVNDDFGHEVGDCVLREFAQILKSSSREIDYIARYGGEEFVILITGSTLDDSVSFIDKLRSIVRSYDFICNENNLKITMSAGVARRSDVESIDDLIKKADEYVYKAKQNGRNRVISC